MFVGYGPVVTRVGNQPTDVGDLDVGYTFDAHHRSNVIMGLVIDGTPRSINRHYIKDHPYRLYTISISTGSNSPFFFE